MNGEFMHQWRMRTLRAACEVTAALSLTWLAIAGLAFHQRWLPLALGLVFVACLVTDFWLAKGNGGRR